MNEWPEASRLAESLNRRAELIQPGKDGWNRITEIVEGPGDRAEAIKAIPIVQAPVDVERRRWARPLLAVAAAIALIAGVAVSLLSMSDDVRTDTADSTNSSDESAQSVDEAPIEREFQPFDECLTLSQTESEYDLVADDSTTASFAVEAGSLSSSEPFVVFAQDADVGRRIVPRDEETELLLRINPTQFRSISELQSFYEAADDSHCSGNGPTIIAVGPQSIQLFEAACGIDQGFHGFVALDAIPTPPESCEAGRRPVYLIGTSASTDPMVLEWAGHQGCVAPEEIIDTGGSTVTRWRDCEASLVHVQTSNDVATDPPAIEGVPFDDFVKSISRLAG